MGIFDGGTETGSGLPRWNHFAEDFELVEETDARGRLRRKARYLGTWQTLRRPEADRWKLPAALALSLLCAAALAGAAVLPHTLSGQLTVMLPLLLGLLPALYLLMGAAALPFRGRPMRRDQYMHSFIRVSRSAVAVAAFALVALAAALIVRALDGFWIFLPWDWRLLARELGAAALALGLIFLLRSVDIAERENGAFPPQTL